MKIDKDCAVSFDYTLSDGSGRLLDSSQDQGPMVYLHGHTNIIPGLESKLSGKAIGDQLKVTVNPDEGYGLRDEDLVHVVQRNQFARPDQIDVGVQFEAELESGPEVFTIVAVEGDKITIDGNHPLAGIQLNFDVKIVDVRKATDDEIAHGHIHEPDEQTH